MEFLLYVGLWVITLYLFQWRYSKPTKKESFNNLCIKMMMTDIDLKYDSGIISQEDTLKIFDYLALNKAEIKYSINQFQKIIVTKESGNVTNETVMKYVSFWYSIACPSILNGYLMQESFSNTFEESLRLVVELDNKSDSDISLIEDSLFTQSA